MKLIVFNVGPGLSVFIENGGNRAVYDIGCGGDFSPVNDFLIPYYEKKLKATRLNGKYSVSQAIFSHPHDDHISDIKDFDKHFSYDLLTTPNQNEGMNERDNINWSLVKNRKHGNPYLNYLKDQMLPGRKPPLKVCDGAAFHMFYIPCKDCEEGKSHGNGSSEIKLDKSEYANNISLVFGVVLGGVRFLLPGDLMKDGNPYLIKTHSSYKKFLEGGVDYLVAPHHGLQSAFSTEMFAAMKGGKTRCLNIVSEKPTSKDENRQVDSRYSTADYCQGQSNLSTQDAPAYQRKTSGGHIAVEVSAGKSMVHVLDNDQLKERYLK